MASKELAAMLDELMGRNRNANPNEKVREVTWEDESNCKYFLVDFCPHELFTNTKADLGTCPNIHDDEMRKQFAEAKDSSRKLAAEDDFLRFCQKMLNDVGLKIKRSKERLVLTQMEQAAAAGITPEVQRENNEKINVLTDKINVLVDQAEKAGCEGDVDEAQSLLKVCDQLKSEREELKGKLCINTLPLDPNDKYGPQKAMEVCEICGAFLVIGDPSAKLDVATANKIKKWQDDHLMGKMHMGYARLKASVDNILDERRKKREEKEKEREELAEERRKKREESRGSEKKDEEKEKKRSTRSRSRDRKRSRDRRRSRSRSRGRRSRSRDRRRRSRSRDRKSRRSRSRSRDRRRDRSRDRRH